MNKLFGKYSREARLFPALLCSLPFIVFAHFALSPYVDTSFLSIFFKLIVPDLSFAAVLTYLLAQISRFISKVLFENRRAFPTVKMLLPSSKEMSVEFRSKLDFHVRADHHLALPTLQDEQSDIENTKTRISEIVSLIINKVKDGRLLLQFNIEYGFMRNLIGGSTISILMSLFCVFYFTHLSPDKIPAIISIVLSCAYLLPIIFSKLILNHYSKAYAMILFREYVGNK